MTSDKQLVKQLQKEVARLEAELRTPEPSSSGLEALLLEKDMTIEKVSFVMTYFIFQLIIYDIEVVRLYIDR